MLKLDSVKTRISSLAYVLMLLLALVILPGCSALQPQEPADAEPALHPVNSIVKDDVVYTVDIYDPWEGMNRNIYIFNTQLDRFVLNPVAQVYKEYVPFFLRDGIHNFYSNLTSINHTFNSALQLKGEATVNNGLRFISNTTIGVLGVFDVATQMGFPEMKEDFGQTLGYWGVGDGPYIVLPLFGPSNLRDTGGLVGDMALSSWYLDELGMNGNEGWLYFYYIMETIDTRAKVDFRYYENGSPFEYETVRMFYTHGRRAMIGE
jgi:phospholipid-binding lipoprotein MlaA